MTASIERGTIARIGIDLGGTKIEGIGLAADGAIVARQRVPAPQQDYRATITALAGLVGALEAGTRGAEPSPVGIGIPGSVSKQSGRVQNANSTWINGQDLAGDLRVALKRPVTIANDANCFTLSEATDGAGAGCGAVLGVILGTGTGSGIVLNGRIVDGPLGIGGELGHNPLPWAKPEAGEVPGPRCWCGRHGCIETWVSGPALSADHARHSGLKRDAAEIADLAQRGDAAARASLARHADRLARALAHAVNFIDPDVIVLGGGLSNLNTLYGTLPDLMCPHIFSVTPSVRIVPPKWGDSSGVRGAAWLNKAP